MERATWVQAFGDIAHVLSDYAADCETVEEAEVYNKISMMILGHRNDTLKKLSHIEDVPEQLEYLKDMIRVLNNEFRDFQEKILEKL